MANKKIRRKILSVLDTVMLIPLCVVLPFMAWSLARDIMVFCGGSEMAGEVVGYVAMAGCLLWIFSIIISMYKHWKSKRDRKGQI